MKLCPTCGVNHHGPCTPLAVARVNRVQAERREREANARREGGANAAPQNPPRLNGMHDPEYVLELQRALFELIELNRSAPYNERVEAAKELIRCTRLGCGNGGACNGVGLPQYPCPLRKP